jgi:hypothetical protein
MCSPAQTAGQAPRKRRDKPRTLQFKALEGSKEGQSQLYELPSQQVSFTVPALHWCWHSEYYDHVK